MPYPAILRRAMLAVVVAGAVLPVVMPAADMARAASCPEQPLTVPELLALWDDDGVLGFMGYVNHAGRRCYGTHEIGIVGYVNDPPATGYEEPLTVTPSVARLNPVYGCGAGSRRRSWSRRRGGSARSSRR